MTFGKVRVVWKQNKFSTHLSSLGCLQGFSSLELVFPFKDAQFSEYSPSYQACFCKGRNKYWLYIRKRKPLIMVEVSLQKCYRSPLYGYLMSLFSQVSHSDLSQWLILQKEAVEEGLVIQGILSVVDVLRYLGITIL